VCDTCSLPTIDLLALPSCFLLRHDAGLLHNLGEQRPVLDKPFGHAGATASNAVAAIAAMRRPIIKVTPA
jgi:hypothetical protein